MTTNSIVEDIRKLLVDNSFGTEAVDIFSYEWGSKASPGLNENGEIDKQVLIIETEAIDTDLKGTYEQPVFQILVRGDKVDSGAVVRLQARLIYEFLIAQPTQAINGQDYLEFENIGGLVSIGRDTNQRFVYVMNFFTFTNSID